MRVEAEAGEGEFGHVDPAERDGTGLGEPSHDRGVPCGGVAADHARADRRDLPGKIDHVLDDERDAVEQPGRTPVVPARRRCGGLSRRTLARRRVNSEG